MSRASDASIRTRRRPRAGALPCLATRSGAVRALLVPILTVVAASAGCGAPGMLDDEGAASILVVHAVSPESAPFGDVMTSNGIILDDTVSVTFSAHLKAGSLPPGSPSEPTLQEIVVERYEVTYRRTDGGSAIPAGFTRGMNSRVRLTEQGAINLKTTTISLVILPATSKTQPPVSFLITPGLEPDTGYINIQLDAEIRFYGRTIAGEPVSAVAAIGMNLTNWGDDN